MRRQLPPSHLKVPPGPHAFPRQHFLGESTVVNYYSGFEKAIPAIPALPGFRTSAGRFCSNSNSVVVFWAWCCVLWSVTAGDDVNHQHTKNHESRFLRQQMLTLKFQHS